MTLPKYVERGGEQVFPPPFIANGVQFFGFVVTANAGALQKICDRYLNEPSHSHDFVPVASHVLFVFNDLAELYVKDMPWRERGVYTEQEGALWMLVHDQRRGGVFWFHPYMVVDSGYAMAMGREVYGFPKEMGWLTVPNGPATPAGMSAETVVVRKFGPSAPATREVLFKARAVGGGPSGEGKDLDDISELARHVVDELGYAGELRGAGLKYADDILGSLLRLDIPMVFLKQFRDGRIAGDACYQSLQKSVTRMTRFRGARIYAQKYEIDLSDFESHPIRCELGFPTGPLPVSRAFWAMFDFEISVCTQIYP